jgi:hypothetical protein
MDITLDEQIKKTTYTENVKKAIYKYREKNIEQYNSFQRMYYENKKNDTEWKKQFNERCRLNNAKYREKRRQDNPPKPKGRPRKPIPNIVIDSIEV